MIYLYLFGTCFHFIYVFMIIGDKVWLCEGCVIMPGVKIGDGAIVGAHAFVTSNVPAHALVSGNPAVVVDEDILWKY